MREALNCKAMIYQGYAKAFIYDSVNTALQLRKHQDVHH